MGVLLECSGESEFLIPKRAYFTPIIIFGFIFLFTAKSIR